MHEADMQAEQQLVDDISRRAREVMDGLRNGDSPTAWQQQRQEIAVLRQRIRTMRDAHLGRSRD